MFHGGPVAFAVPRGFQPIVRLLVLLFSYMQQVVVSAECLEIIKDCCQGTPLPSENFLLNIMEPPRREKRGSVRVANMIANKGLPVELEPVEGLFLGKETSNSPVPASASSAAPVDTEKVATETAAKGSSPDGRNGGPNGVDAASGNDKVQGTMKAGASVGVSSAEKKMRRSKMVLGAAGNMRADASAGLLTLLDGFVPGPVTDMLAVSVGSNKLGNRLPLTPAS